MIAHPWFAVAFPANKMFVSLRISGIVHLVENILRNGAVFIAPSLRIEEGLNHLRVEVVFGKHHEHTRVFVAAHKVDNVFAAYA